MSVSSFEILPDDVLYEIFCYLSPIDILQSLFLLTKRLSRIISNEYLWHIHIGDTTMSLMMFNDQCQNILKLIGGRVVSLRVTLIDVIGGWSLISSSLPYHPTTLLQRLHLIDIKPHEFDKLLRNHLIKQLHTLLVDVTSSNPFNYLQVEGIYLVKVCSRMPLLKICRLSFDYDVNNVNQIDNNSLGYQITLQNLLNSNHLRSLTIGIHTSCFLERLLLCIPFIENLSFGIKDEDSSELPTTIIDAHLLRYLSRLCINCMNSLSFHRIITFVSSVFGQLGHFSLKLEAVTSVSDPLIISGDIIQQLCIDRLQPMATYILNLILYATDTFEEKIIFNSFFKVPFIQRQRPRVFIEELDDQEIGPTYHCFRVYTLPYNDKILSSYIFSKELEKSCQMPVNPVDLFPRADTLSLRGYKKINRVRDLGNCRSSISSLVPWSLLTNISINHSYVLTPATLESILRMAYNVHILEIFDDSGILFRPILNNHNLTTLINQQIESLKIFDITLTLQNAQRICTLLSNRLCNLKKLSFNICDAYCRWKWKPSCIVDGKNKSTRRIVTLIYLLVDKLQKLVSLDIGFSNSQFNDTPCFPHLIRRQLHQYPLNRPFRLRFYCNAIELWL
ncbi:unnamed protein product [Rotaria sp. Silwood1]|nr:unnamed protein product [Rotaria sp. Silwood1]CAF3369221.1 unnamed protein product [Rotaria sp. Silwood1]CAF3400180.1 unnamed protein product [Rotaria sp. Silwood1]CAF4607220.1 unnamed protein product [Rotaria sp. Silwood1]CAF4881442.1 unnamed protein product [Rotaria sp. Silwood1]